MKVPGVGHVSEVKSRGDRAKFLGKPEGRDTFFGESPGVARGGMVNHTFEGYITIRLFTI